MWMQLTLASALLLGCYDIARKHGVRGNAVMPVLFFATLSGGIFFATTLAATGALASACAISGTDLARVALKSLIVTGSWVCEFYAMRALPISIFSPIRGSAPFWTLLGAILLFHELPNFSQAAGMVVVLAGYGLFSWAGRAEGIRFEKHHGILLAAIGTILGATSALYDKFLLQKCHIPTGKLQFWFCVWLVVFIGAVWAAQRGSGLARTAFAWRWTIPVVGVGLVLSDWCYFHALAQTGVPISIVSLVRRSNVVLSFTAGVLLFNEGNLRRKALALATILIGVAILCLAR